MDFVTAFLTGAGDVVAGFGDVLVDATGKITDIVYNSTDSSLTIVGATLAMALGIGAIYLIFRMVRGLIKQNNRG